MLQMLEWLHFSRVLIQELLELQRERQCMEKQHQQETNRLNQEIQQARTQHNTLQSQYDKVCFTFTVLSLQ